MTQTVKVEGLSLLQRRLKVLDETAPKAIKALNRESAEVALPFIRELVPVQSGDLLGTVRAGATARSGYVRAGSSAVPYAPPIHWGWPARDIVASLFLTRGLGAAEPTIVAGWRKGVLELVDEVGL